MVGVLLLLSLSLTPTVSALIHEPEQDISGMVTVEPKDDFSFDIYGFIFTNIINDIRTWITLDGDDKSEIILENIANAQALKERFQNAGKPVPTEVILRLDKQQVELGKVADNPLLAVVDKVKQTGELLLIKKYVDEFQEIRKIEDPLVQETEAKKLEVKVNRLNIAQDNCSHINIPFLVGSTDPFNDLKKLYCSNSDMSDLTKEQAKAVYYGTN